MDGGTVSQDKISVSVYTCLGVNHPFGCPTTITWRENNTDLLETSLCAGKGKALAEESP